MNNKFAAVIDDTLFYPIVKLKDLMGKFDNALNDLQLIHKDNLQKSIESGDFISDCFFPDGLLHRGRI